MYVMFDGMSEDRSATGPQWFPVLQWYVEEETSSRNEILQREEETTLMEDKFPQEKNKSPQEKTKPPQEDRHSFPVSFQIAYA